MADERSVTPWHEAEAKLFQDMESWRRSHPHASFAEIEAAVEERLGALRAELIAQELALRAAGEATEGADRSPDRARCPTCGAPTEARGMRERTVTVRGNRPVRLRRRYVVCPACGTGHFPPG
jgi:YgiT-type zinc finger domain-containing protein